MDPRGCFSYFGEGQVGDMTMTAGNRAIANSLALDRTTEVDSSRRSLYSIRSPACVRRQHRHEGAGADPTNVARGAPRQQAEQHFRRVGAATGDFDHRPGAWHPISVAQDAGRADPLSQPPGIGGNVATTKPQATCHRKEPGVRSVGGGGYDANAVALRDRVAIG